MGSFLAGATEKLKGKRFKNVEFKTKNHQPHRSIPTFHFFKKTGKYFSFLIDSAFKYAIISTELGDVP